MTKNESLMKTGEKKCPYCGSMRIIMCKLPPGALVDPAPSIFVLIKNAFCKRYKCEDCGKAFN